MRRPASSDEAWRCLVHSDDAWETAVAMGAAPPCQIPLPESYRQQLAGSLTLDLATAKILARDPTRHVRSGIARNESVSPELRQTLVTDPDPVVRIWALVGVAQSPDTSPAVLESMSESEKDPKVQQAIARNPRTPVPVLERMGRDHWRTTVARNPSMPPATLEQWSRDPDDPVMRAKVAGNTGAPIATLKRLASDPDWSVRWTVALNPKTPMSVLGALLNDPDPNVSKRAEQAIQTLSASRPA